MLKADLRVISLAPDIFVTVEITKTYHQSLNSYGIVIQ